MQLTISSSDYTFDASAKTITLIDPFDVVTTEQIYHIINISTGAVIYDSDRRTHPISMAGAVITHTYDNTGMADADTLQISLDDGTSGVVNHGVFLVSGTPSAGVGEVGDIAIDEDTGDIYEKESVVASTAWNPSDKSTRLTLSGDDLIATHHSPDAQAIVRSVIGVTSGKWYWEYRMVKAGAYRRCCAGVADSLEPLDIYALGYNAGSYGYDTNGNKRNANVGTIYGDAWAWTGTTIIGIAVDMDAGKIWWSNGGVWQDSGDPANGTNEAFSGLSGTLYAAVGIYKINDYTTANFGGSAFIYPVPSGFSPGLGGVTTPWVKKLAVPKSNISASADPATGDDSDDGYSVGSRWENITDDREFVCLDATVAAAVWLRTTGSVIPEKTPVNAVAAQGTITTTGHAGVGDEFVIGNETYEWVNITPGYREVLIGTASEEVTNIVTAITAYSDIVSAIDGALDTVVVTVDTKGTSGNSMIFTETTTGLSMDGSGTLGGTTSGVDGTVGEANELCANATYLFLAIARNTISDANWRRIALGSVY